MKIKKTLLFVLTLFVIGCQSETIDPITEYQKSLINDEITGSNVFKLVKEGEVVYEHIENSGKYGDKDINDETIFPIWSMSKPVTTVAMMILYDQGAFELTDNLSDYLPEYKNMMCKNSDGVEPCKNQIQIIDLLTHRSGFGYYSDVYGENNFTAVNVDGGMLAWKADKNER